MEGKVVELDLYWNEEERGLMVGSKIVNFTRVEWKFLSALRSLKPVSYEDLAQTTHNRSADKSVRIYIDKCIDRVRVKLRKSSTGLYVYCVLGYGYVLMPGVAVKRKVQAV